MATHVSSRGLHNTETATSSNKAYAESIRQVRGKRQRLRTYGYVLLTTVCMLILLFVTKGIAPFGENLLRYTGDGAQYYGILGYLQNTFFTNNDMLYSWSAILGGKMIGTFAYYAASPFNLLTALFPGNLIAAYHMIFVLKFLCAALCFAIVLENVFHAPDAKTVILFSASYPFIGYMSYYAWNQSWMDGVALLPIVVLGVWQIVREQKWLLYTVSLAIALCSNYYIGYMVWLGSAFLFGGVCALTFNSFNKALLRALGMYLLSSLLAAGMVSVLLIPTYSSLPSDRAKSLAELIDNVNYTSKPNEVLSMLYTAPFGNMKYEDNYPVIYTGIVQLLLAITFFVNKGISRKWKLVAGALLLIFTVSFGFSTVNIAWHGFSENVWYNFRYSFIVSFLLEVISFCSFSRIQDAKGRFTLAGVIVIVITVIALEAPKENVRADTLFWDILWICCGLILLSTYASSLLSNAVRSQKVCFALIFALTLGNLFQNMFCTMNEFGKSSELTDALQTDQEIEDLIAEDGFYRMGSTWRYGSNDPMRVGYAGVENFASTENPEAVDAVKKLGIRAWYWRSYYGHNVPISTDALLGLKYVVALNDSFKAGFYEVAGEIETKDVTVYSNPFALPLIFPVAAVVNSDDYNSVNTFEYLNSCWNAITTVGGDIFSPIDYSHDQNGDDIKISFTAKDNGPVYAYIPRGNITVDVTPKDDREEVFYLGTYAAGQDGELTLHLDGSYDKVNDIVICQEDTQTLEQKADTILRHDITVDKITSSNLKLTYDADADGCLTTTIPYDDGWQVVVDGAATDTYRNMNTFLAFDVTQGEHEIELRYWPPYLTLGAWVSVATVGVVVALQVHDKRHAVREAPAKSQRQGARQRRKTSAGPRSAGSA